MSFLSCGCCDHSPAATPKKIEEKYKTCHRFSLPQENDSAMYVKSTDSHNVLMII
jgi:hypothetical protein